MRDLRSLDNLAVGVELGELTPAHADDNAGLDELYCVYIVTLKECADVSYVAKVTLADQHFAHVSAGERAVVLDVLGGSHLRARLELGLPPGLHFFFATESHVHVSSGLTPPT